MRMVQWILAGIFFTASCDVILVLDVGGSVRFSQFLLVLLCGAALARMIQDGRILWPRGSTALALWLLSQLLFLPLSGVIPIGIQFFALLLLTVLGVFAVVQLYGNSEDLGPLLRLYLLSYVFVGLFGLLQFTLPLLGGPGILVAQWMINGKVARINGFSYEPSYYATYLMIGWIMLVELRVSKAKVASSPLWKWATIAVTISLILSSSRTAWVFMLVELFARILPLAWRAVCGALRQAVHGTALIRLPGPATLIKATLAVVVIVGSVTYLFRSIDPLLLLSGTGIGNTAAHSFNSRHDAAFGTLDAFLEHPFIGRSLGGVPIYLASRLGVEVKTMADVRLYWGFPVFFDLLVASGIFGAIPFFLFVYATTFGALRTAKQHWPSERAKWVRAMARAMIFEWMLLMTDQNLLRVYVWVHISMVALFAYHLEFGTSKQRVPATLGPQSSPQLAAATTS
jgi:hypothetical protein